MKKRLFLFSAILVIPFAASAEPVSLHPGQWAMKIEIYADGGTTALNSQSITDCMLGKDASMEPTALATAFAGGTGCTASNVQQDGNQVTFQLDCADPVAMTGHYTLVHNWDEFSMTADQSVTDFGNTVDLDVKITANRTGSCG